MYVVTHVHMVNGRVCVCVSMGIIIILIVLQEYCTVIIIYRYISLLFFMHEKTNDISYVLFKYDIWITRMPQVKSFAKKLCEQRFYTKL